MKKEIAKKKMMEGWQGSQEWVGKKEVKIKIKRKNTKRKFPKRK